MQGGLYATAGTSRFGRPLEDFLIDAPVPYHGAPFRTPLIQRSSNIGIELKAVRGLIKNTEILFWVGEEYYPYAPDFIEETKKWGVSKRIPLNFDLTKFKPGETWMYFIHPRAVVDRLEPVHSCPKNNEEHLLGRERCITTLYYLVDAREEPGPFGPTYERTIGDTDYGIPKLIPRLGEKQSPGFFMRLPFGQFEYVAMQGNRVDPKVQAQIDNGMPIIVVSE